MVNTMLSCVFSSSGCCCKKIFDPIKFPFFFVFCFYRFSTNASFLQFLFLFPVFSKSNSAKTSAWCKIDSTFRSSKTEDIQRSN